MNSNAVFWCGVVGFSLISGNFSPLRLGPILPIFSYLVFIGFLHISLILKFAQKTPFAIYSMLVIIVSGYFASNASIEDFMISGFEFSGAQDPHIYAAMATARLIISIGILIVVAKMFQQNEKNAVIALYFLHAILVISLFFQAIFFNFFDIEIGYIYQNNAGTRFGGILGEPQTLSAWICSTMFCVFSSRNLMVIRGARAWLILSTAASLALTSSTAWIISFIAFMVILSNLALLRAFIFLIFSVIFFDVVYNKLYADLFVVSERSVTLLAGYEFFTDNIGNVIFGYGPGMSPYLLPKSAIFQEFPQLDLSDVGRQNVMNTFLDLTFEFGVIGFVIYAFLVAKALSIQSFNDLKKLLPMLIGMMGVGGGYASGYFLLCAPGLLLLGRRDPLTQVHEKQP